MNGSGLIGGMEQTETTASENPGRKTRSPELVRPVEGRMIAGVAKGVADNFGIADWIPRLIFVVTAFMGGLGLALYAAGWAFIRSEDEPDSPAERFFSGASSSRSWVGIAFIVLAGVIVLDNFTFLAGEVVWAMALLAVGLLLYMGYIPTGKRPEGQQPESKEGVQRMTSDTLIDTTITGPTGDSPAGGSTLPPPPAAPTPPVLPPARPREHSMLGRITIGVMLLAMGVLAILDNIAALDIEANPRHYLALAVTVLGVGLLVGSVMGRARWLILVGLVLVPTLVFSPVFEYDWNEDQFDRTIVPASFEDLEGSYSIDVGAMVIDLRHLDWDGQIVDLTAEVDIGNLEVWLPEGVGIAGEARVDIGRVSGPGGESFGFGDPTVAFDTPGELGLLVLDAEVGAGNIDVFYR